MLPKFALPRLGVKARSRLIVAIATLAGLAIGHLSVARAPSPTDAPGTAPDVYLLGQRLPLDERAAERALDLVRRYASRELLLERPDDKVERVRLADLGAEVDKVRLARLVRDATDADSPLRRLWAEKPRQQHINLPVPIVIDPERSTVPLLRLKEELDRSPADARLDLGKRTVRPEVVGQKLDVQATLSALERGIAEGADRVRIVVLNEPPKKRSSELDKVEFGHVLGYFETRYSLLEKDRARTFNLRLAASKLDGYVLMPGELFPFNDVVGPRDEANGYKVAPVIASGELVDGIGGGTCQISGTLHAAAFFAGLEIVERYPHTRPSSYIKMGLDATVVYPTIDFKLRNPFEFPVVLHQTVKDGVVRAEILGPKHDLSVTLIRRIDSAIPYEEVERLDPTLPRDKRLLLQRGVAGFKVHRYRIVRRGPHAVRERSDDIYPPTTQIVRVGTGEPTLVSKAMDDPHAEYRADELLVLTLRDLDDQATGKSFEEQREAGRYGETGWTEKSGMPQWASAVESTPD